MPPLMSESRYLMGIVRDLIASDFMEFFRKTTDSIGK